MSIQARNIPGPETGPVHGPNAEPDTSMQLVGLEHLTEISVQQDLESAALGVGRYTPDTGPFLGPDTAMQLVGLRHLTEIASGGYADPGIGAVVPAGGPATAGRVTTAMQRLADPVRTRWARLPLLRRVPLPLALVVVVQVALSLRLIWSNTAFSDEALYLWAGHLEWAHWLSGTSINSAQLPTYFSGSPVIYPPLGALADAVGGLAAARLLSLAFMVAATCLLYAATSRLFDRRSALFAVGLFAGVGSTQFLGAFATYDAMALFLLALATWAGVRAAWARTGPAVGLAVTAGAALALADAAKYASTLFDPVVLGVVLLAGWRQAGRRQAAWRIAVLLGVALALIGVGLLAGGHDYWAGISVTTTTRSSGTTPIYAVLTVSARWVGAVAFLAVCGALATGLSGDWRRRLLGCLLAVAAFLAPIEQARIHTEVSLYKHVGYGAWFGCAIAGYALAALARAVPGNKVWSAIRIGTAAAILAAGSGIWYAGAHFAGWPNSTAYVTALKPWLASAHGHVLIDTPAVPEYYLRNLDYQVITNGSYFAYIDPDTGKRITNPVKAYADAIKHGDFALITLAGDKAFDWSIVRDIEQYGGYELVSFIPYTTGSSKGWYRTWVRVGPSH